MKISGVELTTLVEHDRPVTALVLRSDSGLSGIGEIAAEDGGGTERSSAFLADWLIGRDPFDVEALLADAQTIEDIRLVSAATAAMMDISAQGLKTSIHQLLGGRVRDHVRACAVDWTDGAAGPRELADAARRTVALGFTMLRVEPFVGLTSQPATCVAQATEVVRAVRDAVSDDVDIIVVGNRRLDVFTSLEFAGALRSLEPLWIEDPVPVSPLDPLQYVSPRSNLPVAAGRGAPPDVLRGLVTSNLVDHLVIDVGRVGGLVAARRISALAEVHHIGMIPVSYGSSVSLTIALQLAAVTTNVSVVEVGPDLAPIDRGMVSVDHRPEIAFLPAVSG
jgi:L-alanine-DL-glutamate epimerase-like enolase superfamily enzyme